MVFRTRARVDWLIRGLSFSTSDTVERDTPLCSAISLIVYRFLDSLIRVALFAGTTCLKSSRLHICNCLRGILQIYPTASAHLDPPSSVHLRPQLHTLR